MQGFLILLSSLAFVIFVHELGHVIAFRRVGMEIDELAVGLPWGPHLSIKSAFLRRYLGRNFTLILSPLVIAGYVKPYKPEREERLFNDEKALVYGGGVIANILLFVIIYAYQVAIIIVNEGARDVHVLGSTGTYNPYLVLGVFGVGVALFLYFARFVAQYIFPIVGTIVFVALCVVLWKTTASSFLANGSFAELSATTKRASDAGNLLGWIGLLSLILGLGNLIPVYPLDGGHIGKIFVRKFAPSFEPYYIKIGIAIALFLFVLQFVPDLYRLFR